MIRVRVPASASNLGAGFDCVGIALDLWLEARLDPGEGHPIYSGTISRMRPGTDLIAKTLKAPAALSQMHLAVSSNIPVGKGLGSSAAAIAAATALNQLANGKRFDKDAAYAAVTAAEGHPDNAAPAVYGGLVLVGETPARRPFNPALALAFAIPDATIDTKAARALLPEQVSRDTAVNQARRAAALMTGLEHADPDLIKFGMEDQIAVPARHHLIPGFEAALKAARAAGAFGVTISGSGPAIMAVALKELAGPVAKLMATALTNAGNKATPLTPAVTEKGMVAG